MLVWNIPQRICAVCVGGEIGVEIIRGSCAVIILKDGLHAVVTSEFHLPAQHIAQEQTCFQ